MTLFISLLPIYLFGNLHCLGMCGPLVALLGKHRYRYLYFLGRTLSFTLTGALAGALGVVLQAFLNYYHLGASASLIMGLWLILLGLHLFYPFPLPTFNFGKLSQNLSLLLLKDQPLPTFLFGFFTILLPCGQTLIVFSACALAGSFSIGAFNGLMFALLTSPSLILAMNLNRLVKNSRNFSNTIIGSTSCLVGALALLRGAAELGWIQHFVLWEKGHVVLW